MGVGDLTPEQRERWAAALAKAKHAGSPAPFINVVKQIIREWTETTKP